MGHVYISDHIKKRMVAKPGSHSEVKELLRERLERGYRDGDIYGALFQGSSTNNTYSVGSDIDVCVAINSETFYRTKDELNGFKDEIFSKHHVPVEFKPRVNAAYSRKGVNRLPRNFMQHLMIYARNEDNIIGKNPLDVIAPKRGRYAYGEDQDIVAKIAQQLSDIWEDPTSFDPNNQYFCDYLEEIIRRPIWTAFDMIMLMNPLPNQKLSGWNSTFRLTTLNGNIPPKDIIVEQYKKKLDFLETSEHIDAIMRIRRKYIDFLSGIWDIEEPEEEYIHLLKEIKEHEHHASEFMAKNMQFVIEK